MLSQTADFAQPELCSKFIQAIESHLQQPFHFMEVCGTHTMSIFQSGLRSILPQGLVHVSGPGCPVCVTSQGEIDLCLQLAARPGVMLATFGDMLKVPGSRGQSLQGLQAEGSRIRVCYSPLQAVELARQNPELQVVFLAVGFETTAPTVAAAVQQAKVMGLANFKILSLHKLLPPALRQLVQDPGLSIQGFILPGHVSAIIGIEPYRFLSREFALPAVISGFEPLDILQALFMLLKMQDAGRPDIENQYTRVVREQGNPKARQIMQEVFVSGPGRWRGLGEIPDSGLYLAPRYKEFEAREAFALEQVQEEERSGCRCGEVLQGRISPRDCGLFGAACTPASPVGPCMVSTEGSCAAYYKYAWS
ncbi:MAG: hydrogenase formation protein HypD [Desulfohalobiaceae bacterium]